MPCQRERHNFAPPCKVWNRRSVTREGANKKNNFNKREGQFGK